MNRGVSKGLKIVAIGLLFLTAAAYFAGSAMLVRQQKKLIVCQNVKVQIIDSAASQLILPQDIHALLNAKRVSLVGKKIDSVNMYQLEKLLNQEQGVRRGEVFMRQNGVITLSVTQRSPLLRLHTSQGSYYLDDSGEIFPSVPRRTAYVPVVSGNIPIKQQEWMAQLHRFGQYICGNRFWNAQIEQLYVHDPNNIEIIQRAGTQTTVLLGTLDGFENKLQKLYTFYRTVAVTQGWDKYETIDLRFHNQIVCKKVK
jgi:cell division protein FtsQ